MTPVPTSAAPAWALELDQLAAVIHPARGDAQDAG